MKPGLFQIRNQLPIPGSTSQHYLPVLLHAKMFMCNNCKRRQHEMWLPPHACKLTLGLNRRENLPANASTIKNLNTGGLPTALMVDMGKNTAMWRGAFAFAFLLLMLQALSHSLIGHGPSACDGIWLGFRPLPFPLFSLASSALGLAFGSGGGTISPALASVSRTWLKACASAKRAWAWTCSLLLGP